jgi:hypothetical protein
VYRRAFKTATLAWSAMRLHQFQMFFLERIRHGMDKRQHPHQTFARHERHTDRGLRTAFFHRIIGAAQPAFILACIRHKSGFAVLHHPSRKAAFDRLTQLLGGMLVELLPVHNGRFHRLAEIIHHNDAAALTAHILDRSKEQALKDSAKVRGGCNFTTDVY